MGLSKNITLTIKDYEIKLDKQIKFYENDTINLCFSILEYGIEVKNGVSVNKLMPIQALRSYMLIETPQGVDYAESTKIEDNKIVFNLGAKYSQFVGIGHMQIVIKDSDGCRVTLPEFEFEIKKSINSDWERELYFLSTEDDSIIIDEFGRKIHMTKISDMPESENLSEESYAMIIDEEGNKRFKVRAIADAVEDSLDTKFNAYTDEINGDVERIKGEVNEISESLDSLESEVNELKEGNIDIDLTDYAKKSDLHSHSNKSVLDGITTSKITEWNNKSTFDGNYNSLTNKPTIPTKTSQLNNDNGFITSIPSEYVTETELSSKGYLTQHQSLEGLATEEYVKNKIAEAQLEGEDIDLSGYAVKGDLEKKVDKVEGKSLISDSEIVRLATVKNYDDTEIRNTLNNKANASELHSHTNKSVLDNITSSKVNEWNNKSTFDGNYNNLTNKPTIPTNVSDLTNDSGFITSIPSEYVTETELTSKGYLTSHQDISGKADKSTLTAHTNDTTSHITATERNTWNAKSNLALGTTSTTAYRGDYGNTAYTHSQTTHAPSNAQKNSDITKAEIEAKLTGNITSHTHSQYLTSHQDLSDYALKTEIPNKTSQLINDNNFLTSIPSEYVTETELNGKGFLTQHQSLGNYYTKTETYSKSEVDTKTSELSSEIINETNARQQAISSLNERLGQQTVFVAEGLTQEEAEAWLEENGDKSKLYLMPDETFWQYKVTTEVVEGGATYTNLLPLAKATDRTTIYNGKGYKENTKLSGSGGGESTSGSGKEAMCSSGFIFPVKDGDILRIKGVFPVTASNHYVVGYDSSNARTGNDPIVFSNNSDGTLYWSTNNSSGKYKLENNDLNNPKGATIVYTINTDKLGANVNTIRFCAGMDENTIITLNEEIKEGGGTTTVNVEKWVSTGHGLVATNYDEIIATLNSVVNAHTQQINELKQGVGTSLTDKEKLDLIKKWDMPIYDAHIPVFELSTEKNAITEAEKTVANVYAKYDSLMAKYPNYITKTDLGLCSDGVTHVYRYDFREPEPHRGTTGKKEWSETKTKAIIVSGIHWEWGGIFSLYNALEEIAENPKLFDLRRNTHLIVLPVCNPYAVANMSVRNANLVEIHRNFEVDFIYRGEAGFIEYGERSYGGEEPLSEIETQYIDNIFKENTDSALFLTCHSNQSDTVYGTGFTWASPATYYMCNLHYRLVDKLSKSWMDRFGETLEQGIADYRTENTPEWDTRLGSAYLSTTNGTETKQATKYGIQATNVEVCDTFLVHGTKANPESPLSSFTISRGAETYVNFLLTAFGVYDYKDKEQYYKK